MWTSLASPVPVTLPPLFSILLPRVIIRSLQADANTDYKDRPDEKWDTAFALSYVMTMAVPNATETKYLSSTIMLLLCLCVPPRLYLAFCRFTCWFLHHLPSTFQSCIFIITTVYIPLPSHAPASATITDTATVPPPHLTTYVCTCTPFVCIIKIWFPHSWNVEWIFNTATRK